MLRYFGFSILLTAVALATATLFGGMAALLAVAVLGVLELCLSFDNAVVNAIIEPRCEHLVGDRHQPVGALRMIRAHFVLKAGRMGDERGSAHARSLAPPTRRDEPMRDCARIARSPIPDPRSPTP